MSTEREHRGTMSVTPPTCPIKRILPRLDGVREVRPGRWMGKCPAHDDRSPSLSIRELDDGRVLVHCFAGCSVAHVLAAVGLTLADLYSYPLDHRIEPARNRCHEHAAREALCMLRVEALIVAIAAEELARGKLLNTTDLDRLIDAARRIRKAADAVVGDNLNADERRALERAGAEVPGAMAGGAR